MEEARHAAEPAPSSRLARWPLWRVVLFLALAHFVLMLGALLALLSLSGGIDTDEAVLPETLIEALGGLTAVLLQPGIAVWSAVEVEARGADGLEWTVVVLNSLLWGACAALLLRARLARGGPRGCG